MRLIDADALRDELFVDYFDSDDWGFLSHHIDDAPTADAVEVVRCKDCRFHEQEQIGMVYCPATVGGWVEENWFCKGGERRSE